MDNKTKSEPEPGEHDRKAGILAWHEAKTDEERKAAVDKFPWLTHVFMGAHNHAKS